MNRAADYWTPNHAEVGKAGQVLGGLSEIILPLMVGGGNPTPLIGSQQVGTAIDLVQKGADADTAQKVGLLQGQRLPSVSGCRPPSGKRLRSGSPPVQASIWQSAFLNDQRLLPCSTMQAVPTWPKHTETLSSRWGWMSQWALVFGGIAHASASRIKPTDADAVLTASNAKHFQQDTAPGIPADLKASSAHQSALEQAIEQLVRGERVSVPDSILTAEFVRPVPPSAETPIAAAVRGAFGPDLPTYRPVAPPMHHAACAITTLATSSAARGYGMARSPATIRASPPSRRQRPASAPWRGI